MSTDWMSDGNCFLTSFNEPSKITRVGRNKELLLLSNNGDDDDDYGSIVSHGRSHPGPSIGLTSCECS